MSISTGLDQESLEGLGVGALTAGLTTGLDALFDKYWKWGRLDGVAVETNPTVARITYGFDLSNPAGIYGFTAHSASKGLLAAGVQNAVFEGDFKDYLKDALESQGNNVMSALAFYGAGSLSDYLASGSAANKSELGFNVFSEKGFGRTLLHSAAGGAISDAMGGEFRTGAAAAAFNHLTSSAQDNLSRGLGGITPWTQQHGQPNPWRNATSEIAGVLGAALVEGDVEQGRFIAGQAQAYNAELHPDDSELLDKAREIVLADESLSAEEKADRIDHINALACKESRCFDHLPPAIYSTPEAMQLAAWQAKGDADPDDIVSVLESMGLEADGAFDSYGWDSQLGDFFDRNDEVLTRGAGLLQTGGGVVGTFGGAAMVVGGFGSCGVTAGAGCALGAGGVGVAALGVSEIEAGIDRMFAAYETNLHIRTMNSFYPDRHEGERYALGDSFLGIGIFATEMIAGKFGGKVLAKSPLGDWSPGWFGGPAPHQSTAVSSSGGLDYLVSDSRVERYESYLQRLQEGGYKNGEKLAELSGRIHMLKEGYIFAGHGKLVGSRANPGYGRGTQGIDRVYKNVYDHYDFIILESKYRATFSSNRNPLLLLPRTKAGQQMSTAWVFDKFDKMTRASQGDRLNRLGESLMVNGFTARYMNVLSGDGQRFIYDLKEYGLK